MKRNQDMQIFTDIFQTVLLLGHLKLLASIS